MSKCGRQVISTGEQHHRVVAERRFTKHSSHHIGGHVVLLCVASQLDHQEEGVWAGGRQHHASADLRDDLLLAQVCVPKTWQVHHHHPPPPAAAAPPLLLHMGLGGPQLADLGNGASATPGQEVTRAAQDSVP